jgi:hypothetical protein
MPSPLTYAAYPDSDDVMTLLSGAGITVPDNLDVDALIAEAIDDWEKRTRYKPFLGEATARDYTYDPPGVNQHGPCRGGGTTLLLKRGFVADAGEPITVTAGVTNDSAGTLLVEGTDYDLEPANAINDLVPFTSIEFRCRRYGAPRSIVVNGKSGYSLEIPANAWGAIRKMGAVKVLEAMQEAYAAAGAVISEKSGDDEIKYSDARKQGALWSSEASAVLKGFVRCN